MAITSKQVQMALSVDMLSCTRLFTGLVQHLLAPAWSIMTAIKVVIVHHQIMFTQQRA